MGAVKALINDQTESFVQRPHPLPRPSPLQGEGSGLFGSGGEDRWGSADPGPSPLAEHRPGIDRLFAHDTVEEITAALAADGSGWAQAQRGIIARKCPTTLKTALRLVREGAGRTRFADEMAMEYRVAVRMTRRPDFIEGVRAVIVDKDNTPRWTPAALEDVTPAMLDDIFAPLPPGEEWRPLP